jgi:cytochrome c peroxidase
MLGRSEPRQLGTRSAQRRRLWRRALCRSRAVARRARAAHRCSSGPWSFPRGLIALLFSIQITVCAGADSAPPSRADAWWTPNSNRVFPARATYSDPSGIVTVISTAGETNTSGHAFFTAIGSNGRACVTCHQPLDGMSVSVPTIQARWQATQGKDPLFAAFDGSNCPTLPQEEASSHSLLLQRGLFRIARPWPPRSPEGAPIEPQFTIEVVHDPSGCNLDPRYGLKASHPMVSVFRRPRPVANLKYVTAFGYVFEPKNGLPLPLDPHTGLRYSGNLLADQRARTLEEQALDALDNHLELQGKPTDEQMRQIVSFESALFVAQSADQRGGALTDAGAKGGPDELAVAKPGVLKSSQNPQWSEFGSWAVAVNAVAANAAEPNAATPNPAAPTNPQAAFRASVARGAALFRDRTFLISDSAGLNSMNFGNPTRDSCNFCHNMTRTGMDVAPGQVDLGTTNEPFADPAPDLPLFKLTCAERFPPQPFLGRVVYTHDPGFALTTGKCADIGRITIQQMRGLAARAPYFSNGSARSLRDVIDYYDRRYNIGYSEQDKQDLTNLMSVL